LRPVQSLLALCGSEGERGRLAGVISPLVRAIDSVVTRTVGRFRPEQLSGSREMLDGGALPRLVGDLAGRHSIVPAYDAPSIAWLLDRARRRVEYGSLRALVVKDELETVVGWFIYQACRGGASEVLQLCAWPRHHRTVVDHLFDDAWQQGVAMLRGRLEPALAPELSENGALLYRRGNWTLMHSKRPEVSHALQRGDAFFTRLEGEWCVRFP
jgi:hypothetical protein